MDKSQAGKLGGLATYNKYGSEYMAQIGRNGAKKWHELYMIVPIVQTKYAIVRRSDNVIVRIVNDYG